MEKNLKKVFLLKIHLFTKVRLSFSFDKDYYFLNNPNYLLGITDKDTKVLFDIDKAKEENNLGYLSK